MSRKILLLCNTSVFPTYYFTDYGVDCFPYYDGNVNMAIRLLRRLTIKNKFCRKNFWYGKWFRNLYLYDQVIIFAINDIGSIIDDVKIQYKGKKKLIVYFWDPVFRVKECLDYELNMWSFDMGDCKKYGLRYNSTFYFKSIREKYFDPNIVPKHTIYFTGLKKGRYEQLKYWEQSFAEFGFKTNFLLFEEQESRRVSFEENIQNLLNNAFLLDIVQHGQVGLTVRAMESIFFERKLLTTNTEIIKEDFYHPDNIFILGVDDISLLKAFLDRPYCNEQTSLYIEKFEFENWIKRFELT